jgi:pantoate kinase
VRARAFAPGHVSGLFAVHDEAADLLAKGSLGAGWSVAAGATATVEAAAATRITFDGQEAEAPVTRAALARMAPGRHLHVDLRLGLPVGQGFGMSAAGTLAACLAATAITGHDPHAALEAAHRAEVEAGTGLGDAIGSWNGSGELRTRPGIPPHGWCTRVDPPEGTQLAYCVLGQGIPTPRIIRDEAWKRRTRELGDAAVARILAAGRSGAWQAILEESGRFGRALGLMPPAMEAAGRGLPGPWGQSMLGGTLWAAVPPGQEREMEQSLRPHGATFLLGIDPHGARLLR